jgi:hypothetical protein
VKTAKRKTEKKKFTRSNELLLLTVLVVATLLAYIPVFAAGIINWDEKNYLLETPAIRELNWENIKAIFSNKVLKSYNPLVVLSFAVDYHFAKLNGSWYHTVNVVLHLFNSLLVYFSCKLLFRNVTLSEVEGYRYASTCSA